MARIHVLTKKEELDGQRLPGKIVVVVDVLFATSSIAAALANGATDVVPAADGAAARAEAARRPAGSYVLAGELDAETLPGFSHPMPLALLEQPIAGRSLILSTTNGSVAIHRSAGAARVFAAALLNGEAVVRHLVRTLADETVLVVCAGSAAAFNLEDFYGAGHLVSLLTRADGGRHELSDAALASRALHDRNDALECLSQSRIGRMMRARGLEREVAFAAEKGRLDVVPELRDGRMRVARGAARPASIRGAR
ncbi:MAG TPA: 2-phosphosulfolactate phosphatase [Anaeromyxobacter sp.]